LDEDGERTGDAQAVYDVLAAWAHGHGKQIRSKTNRTGLDCRPSTKRYHVAQRAVKLWGKDRCLKVAAAHGRYPYLNYGQPAPYPRHARREEALGDQYCLGDETRFEAIEALFEEEARANYLDRDAHPPRRTTPPRRLHHPRAVTGPAP
jgi:hypothetical protein